MPTRVSASTTSGSGSPVRPKASSAAGDQSTVSRSRSWVRPAVAASVTKAPVSRCTSQASLVVTTPCRVRWRRIQAILGAAKYGSRGSPVRSCNAGACGASSVQSCSVRRSCQTIAAVSGSPLAGSQARTVSPWLARPTATTGSPAAARAARPASTTESSSSRGSTSTRPPGRYRGRTGADAEPMTPRSGQTTRALVPEVPWSTASTGPVITTPSLVSACAIVCGKPSPADAAPSRSIRAGGGPTDANSHLVCGLILAFEKVS